MHWKFTGRVSSQITAFQPNFYFSVFRLAKRSSGNVAFTWGIIIIIIITVILLKKLPRQNTQKAALQDNKITMLQLALKMWRADSCVSIRTKEILSLINFYMLFLSSMARHGMLTKVMAWEVHCHGPALRSPASVALTLRFGKSVAVQLLLLAMEATLLMIAEAVHGDDQGRGRVLCLRCTHWQVHRITESQNVRGWKGPLGII